MTTQELIEASGDGFLHFQVICYLKRPGRFAMHKKGLVSITGSSELNPPFLRLLAIASLEYTMDISPYFKWLCKNSLPTLSYTLIIHDLVTVSLTTGQDSLHTGTVKVPVVMVFVVILHAR
jgi:hypothetical protein